MNTNLKFIHITKCAGTSIEDAGYKHGILWGRYHTEYGWHHKVFHTVNKSIIDKYDWFMVVRNPYDRILSEYYCRWGGIGNTNIQHTKEEMNLYLIDKIKKRDIYGHHYTEQYRYLCPIKKIYIIRYENLNEEFNTIMNMYNITGIKLENQNAAYNKIYNVSDFSKELIDLINAVYHKDFELFHYNKIY
jgi:hypothetical protein